MTVDLKEVTSSNIAKIGYDPETQKLYVKFKRGITWSYVDVPDWAYQEMCEAESVGKYFAGRIKGFYEAERVPEEIEPEKTP